jgi:predicted nuclease of predicted toxin-antitoxin system
MKLLFDQNISFRAPKKVEKLFQGCKHVSDVGLLNCEDPQIWEYAKSYDYSIVTFDSDFYDMSLINGCPPKIIWLRSGNLSTLELIQLLEINKIIIDKFLNDSEYKEISCLEIDWI